MSTTPQSPRQFRSRPGRAFAALALTTAFLGLGVGTAAGDAEAPVRWSVAPATGDGPDGRLSLRHVADPGEEVSDAVAVTNLGTEPAEFAVAVGDGVVGQSGVFDIATGEPTGSGSWISVGGLDEGTVTVPGGETAVLPVIVEVPEDATPGDHPAGIAVGVSTDEDGITVQRRIGVRLHLQVAGELEPALAVSAEGTSYRRSSWVPFSPGTLVVDYEIANEGNVRLGAATTLDAEGLFGLGSARDSDGVDELLPGDVVSRSVDVEVSPWFLLFGDLSVTALAVGEDEVSPPEVASHGFTRTAVPWTELAVVVVLAGVVGMALARRRRTRMAATTASASVGEGAES
ncbi:hypothetical protein C1701_00240 [Actinoalloteichus sp. AHMU CJ021]|uniref:hypothetical protein n=1 Tax=Actinoalloteichus sp. AHMU CJ021 TaxID=2072503 RepID=UPI000CA05790|nr:hypothetical protein C1701_00240 [Actinoalloteichus sp. AHMU CJ021]